jgi:hypothetical protein
VSWWPIPGTRDQYTGDPAADAIDRSLQGLAGQRVEKPTLAQVSGALGAELGERVHVRGIEPARKVPDDVMKAIRSALRDLRSAYRDEFGRPPTTNEVLYTFTFSFGGMPDSLVSGALPPIIDFQAG